MEKIIVEVKVNKIEKFLADNSTKVVATSKPDIRFIIPGKVTIYDDAFTGDWEVHLGGFFVEQILKSPYEKINFLRFYLISDTNYLAISISMEPTTEVEFINKFLSGEVVDARIDNIKKIVKLSFSKNN